MENFDQAVNNIYTYARGLCTLEPGNMPVLSEDATSIREVALSRFAGKAHNDREMMRSLKSICNEIDNNLVVIKECSKDVSMEKAKQVAEKFLSAAAMVKNEVVINNLKKALRTEDQDYSLSAPISRNNNRFELVMKTKGKVIEAAKQILDNECNRLVREELAATSWGGYAVSWLPTWAWDVRKTDEYSAIITGLSKV